MSTSTSTPDTSRAGESPLRTHKDSTFRLLFSEKARAIELYNAVSDEHLPPDTELTYTTLENAVYVDRKNDLGFVINNHHLVLSEQQSTINFNMPLRCLGYASRTIEDLTGTEGIYGKHRIKFPAPEFYVFYTGTETWDSRQLRLSESFLAEPKENSLELVVNVINLNYSKQDEILTKSPTLLGYSKLLHYIRQYASELGGNLKTAIDQAVKRCIKEDALADFLRKYTREVTGMLFQEITAEEFAEIRAKEAYNDGLKDGFDNGFSDGEKAGFKNGEEAGFKNGFSNGEKAGFKNGEEAGAQKKKLEIAANLKKAGIPLEVIAANTGLTREEVEEL